MGKSSIIIDMWILLKVGVVGHVGGGEVVHNSCCGDLIKGRCGRT